ncbi:L,D-transpeptidase family protein [Orrella daihaiensis]|uniref:L,D-transpeptidase family protein n=1 Tax=Orrella daihaiensis TaxID=2782176 RepID=A0ABY4ALE8_9BURK|nr:L,D-transpeptidase family protein [Orrella daihaiensis]UOD50873.1 L,D-transpeptidase family protein [Orrella daihaiensis]
MSCSLFCAGLVKVASAQQPDSAWLSNGIPNAVAVEAVGLLQTSNEDGLKPENYLASNLQAELLALKSAGQPDAIAETAFERRLTLAMIRYLNDLALGRVTAREVYHQFDGSAPRVYDARLELQSALDAGDISLAVERARPKFPLYPALQGALAQYQALAGHSAWQTDLPLPAGRKLEAGQSYPALSVLRERLVALGDLPVSTASSTVYDPALVEGVKAFQRRHGLTDDGVVGLKTLAAINVTPAARAEQIALSMERLRWTPLHQGDRLIAVNLPGFMLYAYEINADGAVHVDLEMRVVVGSSLNHRTPVFDEDMLFIEFSPYWNVPPSIARSETVPALRKDPEYLNKQQMEFVDSAGHVSTRVTPEKIQAVLSGQLRIRQRPGPHNALGAIKFIFPNNDNIFLHHTPSTHLFDRDRRDLSHGCIRVEEPVELAKFVLANEPEWTEERIRQAMDAGVSKTIRLLNPIPVLIGYSTVLARNGTVFFYPDLYGHDAVLRKALSQYKGLQ